MMKLSLHSKQSSASAMRTQMAKFAGCLIRTQLWSAEADHESISYVWPKRPNYRAKLSGATWNFAGADIAVTRRISFSVCNSFCNSLTGKNVNALDKRMH